MDKYVISGGVKLHGEVNISGAKNAAVAILPATILAADVCVVENVPDISDVKIILDIIKQMGGKIRYIDNTTVEIDTSTVNACTVPYELSKNMRASYYFLGALLGRFKKAEVPMPGGCDFGVRPIDQHIKGFEALGAVVNLEHGVIEVSAPDDLYGNQVYLDVVSVGATMNIMIGAVKAFGTTVIENAAKEPHIVDLANFLNSMGADIRGAGTDVIKIHGTDNLHGAEYTIIPDQIEAGTFMLAAAATKGDVKVCNVIPKHLEPISAKLISMGLEVTEYDEAVRVRYTGTLSKTSVKTQPHPGFPTDMQPQMTALLTQAEGVSIVTEGVWDNRFRYVDELRRMGADIQVDGKIAVITGESCLTGAPVKATDLRAGAAMIIAGLAAKGITEIESIYHIERGYDNVEKKFVSLGANIRKITVSDETEIKKAN